MTGPSYPARINPGIIRNPPTRTTPADNVVFPRKNVKLIPTATSNIKRFRLLEISHWPETKTEIEHSHADLPWGGQACMDLPHLYTRLCMKYAYVDVSYPTEGGVVHDIQECVIGAELSSLVALVIIDGAAAGPAFQSALIACLQAKGASWAAAVRVVAGWESECDQWHPH
jgi:hypothetical protein